MQIKINSLATDSETLVIKLLRTLHKKPEGRTSLMRTLDMTESTVRTILKNTDRKKLTKPTTKGHALAAKGKEIAESVNRHISPPKELEIKSFTKHDNNIAYLIKNPKKSITTGINERDSAIKMGADGLIALIQKDRLRLFGTGKTKIEPPNIIGESLDPKKNDIIIITFGAKKSASELAGLAVALGLIGFKLH